MGIKIGVLSDTHLSGVTPELENIFRRFLSDRDLILHAGDVVSTEVVEFLSKRPFHGVCGNMDPVEVRERLPRKKVIEAGPYRIGIIHGSGSGAGLEDRVWNEFSNVDVIVYGHSHEATNHVREGVLLFNPGTASGLSFSGRHSIGLLDFGETIDSEIVEV